MSRGHQPAVADGISKGPGLGVGWEIQPKLHRGLAAAGSISPRPAGVKINNCRAGAPRNRKPAGRRQRTNRKKQVLAPTSCLAASLSRPVWQALTQTTGTVEQRMQNSSITCKDVEGTVGSTGPLTKLCVASRAVAHGTVLI